MNNYWEWSSFFLYFLTFVLSLFIINTLNIKTKDRRKFSKGTSKFIISVSLLVILALIALRSKYTGTDLIRYEISYYNLKNIDYSVSWFLSIITEREPLFALLNIIIGKLSNWNFQMFILVTSIIPFLFLYKTLNKYKEQNINVTIALMFFICFVYIRSYSMVGQAIALAISLYAYTFLEKKEDKKYWLFSLLAIGLHYTAIINILIYFWSKDNKLAFLKRFLMIGAFCVTLIFGEIIFERIFSLLGSSYSSMSFSAEFGLGNTLVRLPLFLLIFLNRKKLIKENPGIKPYLMIFYLDIIISQFKYFNVQFERLTMYTFLPMIFIIPVLYKVIKKRFGILVSVILLVIFIIWFVYTLYYYTYVNPYNIMPYKFFWQ